MTRGIDTNILPLKRDMVPVPIL